MGLDPHGDRLFLLHLLEIYGYDTLLVSEQLCCSWENSRLAFCLSSLLVLKEGWALSAALLGYWSLQDSLSLPKFLWYHFFFCCVFPCASFVHCGSAPSLQEQQLHSTLVCYNLQQCGKFYLIQPPGGTLTIKMDCSPLADLKWFSGSDTAAVFPTLSHVWMPWMVQTQDDDNMKFILQWHELYSDVELNERARDFFQDEAGDLGGFQWTKRELRINV